MARGIPSKAFEHDAPFAVVKAARRVGIFECCSHDGRRALRVHLGPDVPAGLERLQVAIRLIWAGVMS